MEKIQQKTGWMIYPPCLMKTLRNSEVIIISRNHQHGKWEYFCIRCFLYKILCNHQLKCNDLRFFWMFLI